MGLCPKPQVHPKTPPGARADNSVYSPSVESGNSLHNITEDSADLIPENEPVFLLRGQDKTAAEHKLGTPAFSI